MHDLGCKALHYGTVYDGNRMSRKFWIDYVDVVSGKMRNGERRGEGMWDGNVFDGI